MNMLTKSKYILGLQCPKALWIKVNKKERIPEPDKLAMQRFAVGDMIGEFAKKVFPDGIDLSELGFKENIKETQKELGKGVPLFEAGFLIDDVFSRGDVLSPVGDEWDIIEVKSATKVKDVNIHDVSFQKYVYEKAGLKIRKCYLMHVNPEYVKDGEIEPQEFFVQTDITDRVEEYYVGIAKRVENMLKMINAKKEFDCAIGVHCSDPYDCPLMCECWKDVPEGSVFEFYRMRKVNCFSLYDLGIVEMANVSDGVGLTDKQRIQLSLAKNGGKHIDKKEVDKFLKDLKYPVYYLDFETINPGIPKFDGMKPYQRIPFQFSLHIQEKAGGELKHISFLAEGITDPRPKFLQALKDNLGEKGTILVYNQFFEKGVLRESVEANPDFSDWLAKTIWPRITDLWDVFKNFHYYDSKQRGSASIKKVLPVLSELKYDDLEIGKGDDASNEYERITYDENVSEEERKKVRKALEKYCEMDTLAEVEIISGLRKVVKQGEKL